MDQPLNWIDGVNRHESTFLYDEIFNKRIYFRHGLSLRDGAVVFDVGANIGMFSLFVAQECPTAHVYAFEPLPPLFEKLTRNLSRSVIESHVFCCGLSSAAGEVEFTFYPGYSTMSAISAYADTPAEKGFIRQKVLREQIAGHAMGQASLPHLDALLDYQFREQRFTCRLRRMSDVIEECRVDCIDFLKIDVQRAELDVLDGIAEEHWPLVRQIAMEVHDPSHGVATGRVRKLNADLVSRGFDVVVDRDPTCSGTDRYNVYARRSKARD